MAIQLYLDAVKPVKSKYQHNYYCILIVETDIMS